MQIKNIYMQNTARKTASREDEDFIYKNLTPN